MIRFTKVWLLAPFLVASCVPDEIVPMPTDVPVVPVVDGGIVQPILNTPCSGREPVVSRAGCNGCIESFLQCTGGNWACIGTRGVCTPVPDAGSSVPDDVPNMTDASSADVIVVPSDGSNGSDGGTADTATVVADVPPLSDAMTCSNGVGACARMGVWVRNPNNVPICQSAPVGRPTVEVCDSTDNNCDGRVDEGCICVTGTQQPCYSGPPTTRDVGVCRSGSQTCLGTAWGTCSNDVRPRSAEICTNDLDDNCNGRVDELPCTNPAPI